MTRSLNVDFIVVLLIYWWNVRQRLKIRILLQWQEEMSVLYQQIIALEEQGWSPPPVGVYKANFEAVLLFEQCNYAGLGVVVRDYIGPVIGALSQRISLPQLVEHAEALAASRAVSLARELCLSQMIFKGDCLRIIIAINSTEACHTLFVLNLDTINLMHHSTGGCKTVKGFKIIDMKLTYEAYDGSYSYDAFLKDVQEILDNIDSEHAT
ncbi:hypothetical protein CFP56_034647 [Quercus suber]|uniref:RNase H type-1 domain-containing protein n=1 Tax=Quercus suber TaxID=58331 RepID=A0AAW0JCU3_QUESU